MSYQSTVHEKSKEPLNWAPLPSKLNILSLHFNALLAWLLCVLQLFIFLLNLFDDNATSTRYENDGDNLPGDVTVLLVIVVVVPSGFVCSSIISVTITSSYAITWCCWWSCSPLVVKVLLVEEMVRMTSS